MAESEQTPGMPRESRGPRHALPEDMEPAPLPTTAPGPGVHRADDAADPRPAYETYEAPESNLMPLTVAAIAGGALAAAVLLRLRRRRARG